EKTEHQHQSNQHACRTTLHHNSVLSNPRSAFSRAVVTGFNLLRPRTQNENTTDTRSTIARAPKREAGSVISYLFLILAARRQLVRSAGAGRTKKQFAPVRESKIPAVGPVRPVFRLVSIDHHLG